VPLERTLGAMERLREEGLTRHIGVSNFPPGTFREALSLARIFTNQVEFHPYLGQEELIAIAREHDSSVTAYSPVARGKVLHDPTIAEIAREHGTAPAQVALRWLLEQERVIAVPKAAGHANRAANLEALELELGAEDRARIDALPKDRRYSDPGWAPDWDA
jgi:2,5-diketo-D-gluconate reductase B